MATFQALGISTVWRKALFRQSITEPTEIQEKVIPHFLNGVSIFGQAKTGSGKTLAFLLPILEQINRTSRDIQSLIVVPTRELALQITEEIKQLTQNVPEIQSLAVYGGQDVVAQVNRAKKGAQIVVATPGRLLDHLRRGTLSLQSVNHFVLDEADELLHMGFLPEVKQIVAAIPKNTQKTLFSATLNTEVGELSVWFMKDAIHIHAEQKEKIPTEIKQILLETTDRKKFDALLGMMQKENPFLAVIFCRTKIRVKKLTEKLKAKHILCKELHGDLSQAKREQVIKQFRTAKIQYLIATDIAARGLDVEGVTHVFNYDIPHDVDSYTHRIGRTGRAGESGVAVTFYGKKDQQYVNLLTQAFPSISCQKDANL